MARSDRQLHLSTFLTGAALTVTVVAAYLSGVLEGIEGGLYDVRAQKFQYFTPKPTDKIVHVDIDDAALDAIGMWPWPRSLMAELIDEMSTAGAKAIALDILFSEPQKKEWEPQAISSGAKSQSGFR